MSTIDQTIAYLGPAGTYTHEAALSFADSLHIDEPELLECASFDEVFDAVERGRAAFGVVGKENSLEGPVTATLDNFASRNSVAIFGEKIFDVHHCLVIHPDASLEDITQIASHPQGLAQCRRFINEELPGRTTLTTSSTAESARLATTDKSIAGIANTLAAQLHGAHIAAENIEDNFGNQTSFALIGRVGCNCSLTGSRYRTTLALFLQEDKSGALHMILSEFSYAGINLTMIQSRPTKQQLGDYMFFIEFEGSASDLEVQTALNCLRLKLREVKVLGSYPVD